MRLIVLALSLAACGAEGPTTTYSSDAGSGFLPDGAACPTGTQYCDPRGLLTECTTVFDRSNCGRCGNHCAITQECRPTSTPDRPACGAP